MKRIVLWLLGTVAGCTSQDQRGATVSRDTGAAAQSITPADSAALAASEDSILGHSSADHPTTVAPNGDTLTSLGTWITFDSVSGDYGFRPYKRNGVPYLRIARMIGSAPKRGLIWDVRLRVRLPAMDSADRIARTGFCRVNGKDDPTVIAITGSAGDSLYRNAHRAWSFDAATETLREIPATGVSCKLFAGEE